MNRSVLILILVGFLRIQSWAQSCFPGGLYQISQFSSIEKTDLAFGQNVDFRNQSKSLFATLYNPTDHQVSSRPFAIVMFGGSFVSGARNEPYIDLTCTQLAQKGYLVAAIDYRIGLLLPTATEFGYAVYRGAQDSKAAVRFFRSKADSLKFDADKIYVLGFSAGGFNAVHTAFWQSSEVSPNIIPPNSGTFELGTSTPGVSDTISGCLNIAGGIGDTSWINGEKTPISCIHNLSDPVVPYRSGNFTGLSSGFGGSFAIVNKARRQGNFARLKTLNEPGLHLPNLGSPLADTIARYINQYMYEMICLKSSVSTQTKNLGTEPEFDIQYSDQQICIWSSKGGTWRLIDASGKTGIQGNLNQQKTIVHLNGFRSGIYRLLVNNGRGLRSHTLVIGL